MTHHAGTIASLDSLQWQPSPIEPSWILAGQPQARSAPHSGSADGGSSTNTWDCTAGAFRWTFFWDETVLILEGSVRVTSPGGQTSVLKTGDVAHFPAGTTWRWEVDEYVRKLAFHHRPAPRSLLVRIVRKLRALVSPAGVAAAQS